jgi:hypothetical protein
VEEKVLVVRAEEGRIVEERIVEGSVYSVVKDVVSKALRDWIPEESDFVVVRENYKVTVKLPLSSEEYERYSRYGLRRTGSGEAEFEIPVYLVSFANEWSGEDYKDRKIYLVAVYVDEKLKEEMASWAAESTSGS